MPFYVKYVMKGNTKVEELIGFKTRGKAFEEIEKSIRPKADNHEVSLTSDLNRLAGWYDLVRQEAEITPRQSTER